MNLVRIISIHLSSSKALWISNFTEASCFAFVIMCEYPLKSVLYGICLLHIGTHDY